MDRYSFRVYVTDTLQAVAENTAAAAAYCTGGKAGKAMSRRWVDLDKPAPQEDNRTPEEVTAYMLNKLREVK